MPRIAADAADGVIIEWGDDQLAAQVVPRMIEACERIGRDPDEVTRARHMGVIVTDGSIPASDAYEKLAIGSGMYDPAVFEETWEKWIGAFVGSPAQILEQLPARTTELGFNHVMLHVLSVHPDGDPKGVPGIAGSTMAGMRFLADSVMPEFA
jgi:alkanesulfonate monooxygenase SsuD/methylene tetrahydromethanopterin reductase-like flavin-dependent oxidoreductase (luciferase family)